MTPEAPWDIVHIDLSEEIPALEGTRATYILFWWRTMPVGDLTLGPGELHLPAAQLAARGTEVLARHLAARKSPEGAAAPTYDGGTQTGDYDLINLLNSNLREELDCIAGGPLPEQADLSVIVCTRNRPESLERCLADLERQITRPREIIVVDNEPSPNPRVKDAVHAAESARYLHEPTPGLSAARNTGLRAARASLIAFTDDDVTVPERWTGEIALAFERPDIEALTGAVLPASLATEAQVIQHYRLGIFSRPLVPVLFSRSFLEAHHDKPPPVWHMGAGANMAFRREVFERLGLFDIRLGAGAAGCSEDSEFWYRLLKDYRRCLFEPKVVLFHHHREDLPGLRNQTRAYLRGHGAALTAQFSRHGDWGHIRRLLFNIPAHLLRFTGKALIRRFSGRGKVLLAEWRGWLEGLSYLIRPGWHARAALPPLERTRGAPKRPLAAFLTANPYPKPLTDGLFYREKMRAIHALAPAHIGGRILEIGGGESGLAGRLYPDAEIVTVDIDFELSTGAARADGKARFVAGDARRLPSPDDCFDIVTLFDVLEHIDEDHEAAREALRVAKPGGIVLASTPTDTWRYPFWPPMKPHCPPAEDLMAEWGHVRHGYNLAQLADLFGARPDAVRSFLNAGTAIYHDISFSNLPHRWRRLAYALAAPVAFAGYYLHGARSRGLEHVAAWRK